ncbi:MAG: DUF1571 domain-containing protein [Planctomycetes bacterium]|nr:DUF1571 domain-containing protein [Planctomycetota bacterium]
MLTRPSVTEVHANSRKQALSACVTLGAVAALALAYQGRGEEARPVVVAPVVAAMPPSSSRPAESLYDDDATLFSISLLEQAEQRLSKVSTYTAVFYKQERLRGEITPQNQIQLKVRHEPFSVYMRWVSPDVGREVIYVQGANDNQMWVHDGGGIAGILRLVVRWIPLDPHGTLAMSKSRHPISEIGLLNLTRKLLTVRRADQGDPTIEVTMTGNASVDERPCYQFEFTHPLRDGKAPYHKVVVYLDKELRLPVSCITYDWPSPERPNEPLLLEHYVYTKLQLDQAIGDLAFDCNNPEYGCRR